MPTFKRPQFLRRAVEAILAQTYDNWQLIIKEGGDKAVFDTLDGLDLSKITLIYSKDNGITDAMNQAMRISNENMFIWANDDDVLLPHALETIAKSAKNEWGFAKMRLNTGEIMGVDCNLENLKRGNYICQPTVYWSRYAYSVVGPMNERFPLCSDYEYWTRLMREFPHDFIDEVIAEYTIHKDQTTITQRARQDKEAAIIRANI